MGETNSDLSPLRGKKILWVEDDSFLNYIIAQKLEHEKITLLIAIEGNKALSIAEKEKPDIIVLDIMLSGMDGIEILSRLKKNPLTQNIPVFVFSNLDDKEKINEIMRLGAESFFLKATMTLEETLSMIGKVISK